MRARYCCVWDKPGALTLKRRPQISYSDPGRAGLEWGPGAMIFGKQPQVAQCRLLNHSIWDTHAERVTNCILLPLTAPVYQSRLPMMPTQKDRGTGDKGALLFPRPAASCHTCGIILAWIILFEFKLSSSILDWTNGFGFHLYGSGKDMIIMATDGTLSLTQSSKCTPPHYKKEKHKNNQ